MQNFNKVSQGLLLSLVLMSSLSAMESTDLSYLDPKPTAKKLTTLNHATRTVDAFLQKYHLKPFLKPLVLIALIALMQETVIPGLKKILPTKPSKNDALLQSLNKDEQRWFDIAKAAQDKPTPCFEKTFDELISKVLYPLIAFDTFKELCKEHKASFTSFMYGKDKVAKAA